MIYDCMETVLFTGVFTVKIRKTVFSRIHSVTVSYSKCYTTWSMPEIRIVIWDSGATTANPHTHTLTITHTHKLILMPSVTYKNTLNHTHPPTRLRFQLDGQWI
jgi:hypothetical protein